MAEPTILVIEDEPGMRRLLHAALGAEGYRIVESSGARRGVIDAGSHKPDMAMVDLGLPDGDGVDVIRRIREWSSMPILVLSARSHERSKVEALDAGADDYVTKPFAVGELLARVRAAMRHAVRGPSGDSVLQLGRVAIDLEGRRATRDGEEMRLTATEWRLLSVLARHVGRVATHKQLLTDVWGPTHAEDTHYLRVYMKQLRGKLEADPLQPRYLLTETGIGYRLVPDDGTVP